MKNLIISIIIIIVAGVAIYAFIKDKRERAGEENVTGGTATSTKNTMSFFITSANPGEGGDLGGLPGADRYCTTLAESAGVTGKTWHAYLSTSEGSGTPAVNARDRIGDGPWYNANGELIAQTLDELHGNNNLNKSTALTEQGNEVMGRGDAQNLHDMLTGSTMDGLASTSPGDTTCHNWTSGDEGAAIVGHHDRMGIDDSAPMKAWNSSHMTRGCSLDDLESTGGGGLFYCFATE